jgi:hypothetical protein
MPTLRCKAQYQDAKPTCICQIHRTKYHPLNLVLGIKVLLRTIYEIYTVYPAVIRHKFFWQNPVGLLQVCQEHK